MQSRHFTEVNWHYTDWLPIFLPCPDFQMSSKSILFILIDELPESEFLLTSKTNRPLLAEFEDKLHILIYFHLQEHTSGRHLLQSLSEDTFARENIGPKKGLARSSFFEAMNERDLKQFLLVFEDLQQQAYKILNTASQGIPPHFAKPPWPHARCLPV